MIKRILITGGAGCLGSNLLEHLFKQGHELLVIDNFATGKKEVVPEQNRLSLVEGTIADEDLVDKSFEAFKPTLLYIVLLLTRIQIIGQRIQIPIYLVQFM